MVDPLVKQREVLGVLQLILLDSPLLNHQVNLLRCLQIQLDSPRGNLLGNQRDSQRVNQPANQLDSRSDVLQVSRRVSQLDSQHGSR